MNKNLVAVLFTPLFLLLVVYPLFALVARLELTGVARTTADPCFWLSVRNTVLAAFLAAFLGLVLPINAGTGSGANRTALVRVGMTTLFSFAVIF